MNHPRSAFIASIAVILLLSSCEFKCNVADTADDKKAVKKDDMLLYNGIDIVSVNGFKLNKAYLVFKNDGKRVPDDNMVDFKQPIEMILEFKDGWKIENEKAYPGASEKIEVENGQVLVDEADLFKSLEADGVSAKDAKVIRLTASVSVPEGSPPTTFKVSFKVWDKKSEAFVEGNYKLHSK
jgi:hypothetical protein